MIMQTRIIAPIPEVKMLRYSLAQTDTLAHVNAHTFVEAQHAIEIDGAAVRTQVARDEFQGVEGPPVLEEGPYLGANGAEEVGGEKGVPLDPVSVTRVVF